MASTATGLTLTAGTKSHILTPTSTNTTSANDEQASTKMLGLCAPSTSDHTRRLLLAAHYPKYAQ